MSDTLMIMSDDRPVDRIEHATVDELVDEPTETTNEAAEELHTAADDAARNADETMSRAEDAAIRASREATILAAVARAMETHVAEHHHEPEAPAGETSAEIESTPAETEETETHVRRRRIFGRSRR